MAETPISWLDGIPVVLAAARQGSATAAGAQLRSSTATTLRRLQRIEDALGVALFDRTPGGLRPTGALERALPWAEQIEAAAHGLMRELHGLETEASGTVRVALLSGLSSWFLAPHAPELRRRHPDITLELVPASAVVALEQRQADLALRLIRPNSPDFVVEELVSVPMRVVAAETLLNQVRPTSLSDLPWLDWDQTVGTASGESRWLSSSVPEARVVLRSNELATLIRAAQEGVGAIVLGEQLAVVAGGLRAVPMATPHLPVIRIYLVAHRAVRPVPRIDAVWQWIREIFSDTQRAALGSLDEAVLSEALP